MWAALGLIGLWIGDARAVPLLAPAACCPALVLSCGMMLLPFVPGIGDRVNDANAWVAIGPLRFQPSEFLKLAVLLYCADLLAKRQRRDGTIRRARSCR